MPSLRTSNFCLCSVRPGTRGVQVPCLVPWLRHRLSESGQGSILLTSLLCCLLPNPGVPPLLQGTCTLLLQGMASASQMTSPLSQTKRKGSFHLQRTSWRNRNLRMRARMSSFSVRSNSRFSLPKLRKSSTFQKRPLWIWLNLNWTPSLWVSRSLPRHSPSLQKFSKWDSPDVSLCFAQCLDCFYI